MRRQVSDRQFKITSTGIGDSRRRLVRLVSRMPTPPINTVAAIAKILVKMSKSPHTIWTPRTLGASVNLGVMTNRQILYALLRAQRMGLVREVKSKR